MKKRIVALALVVVMALFVMVACSPGTDAAEGGEAPAASAETAPEASDAGAAEAAPEAGAAADAAAAEGGDWDASAVQMADGDFRMLGAAEVVQESRADVERAIYPEEMKQPADITLGFAQFTMANPYFAEEVNTFERRCEELGFKHVVYDGQNDMQQQSADFDTLITQQVDLIITDVKDPVGNAPDIQRAVDAGIPVIAIDGGVDLTAPLATLISPSPFDNGVLAGQYMAQSVSGDAVVAGLVSGALGNPVGAGRRFGMIVGLVMGQMEKLGIDGTKEDAIAIADGIYDSLVDSGTANAADVQIEIINQIYGDGNWDVPTGLTAAEDILQTDKPINLIFAENDFMAMGAFNAIKEAGKQDQIIVGSCADASKEALDAIKAGELACTGMNNPQTGTIAAVDLAKAILCDGYDAGELPFNYYLNAVAVTADNVDEWYPTQEWETFTKVVPVDWTTVLPKRDGF